jgi:NAD(P)-dependent dehydrogenase (short-subunit alcohol dehydrogenase family)
MKLTPPRRVAVVTGGTDGIGRAVAIELARAGDRVLFIGRDAERGGRVLSELEAARPGAEHAFIRADLSLLDDTLRAAHEVARRAPRVDAAVFCAGILATIPQWTVEGLERSFVLNYLSRYLLLQRLLPQLLRSESGRVVLVANAGKYPDTLRFDDLQHRRGKPGLQVAGRTQFANDLLATELAARLQGTRVEVTCVFPGVVKTRVFHNARGLPWIAFALGRIVQTLIGLSPRQAAETPVFLARSQEASGTNGRFFGPRRKPLRVPDRALRIERREGLWNASDALLRAQCRSSWDHAETRLHERARQMVSDGRQ